MNITEFLFLNYSSWRAVFLVIWDYPVARSRRSMVMKGGMAHIIGDNPSYII